MNFYEVSITKGEIYIVKVAAETEKEAIEKAVLELETASSTDIYHDDSMISFEIADL